MPPKERWKFLIASLLSKRAKNAKIPQENKQPRAKGSVLGGLYPIKTVN
jgi:hypothetical protein